MKEKEKIIKIIERVGIFLGTILLLYLIYKFAVYFMPFLIAAIIAILIEPIIKFCMNKIKLSRRVSSFIVVTLTIVLLGLAIFYGSLALVREALELTTNIGPFLNQVTNGVQQLIENISSNYQDIPEQVVIGIENSIVSFVGGIGGLVTDWAGKVLNIVFSVPTMVLNLIITILALVFFTKDRIYVIDLMEYHMPKNWIKKIIEITSEIFSTIGGYIRVYAKIILITFAELYLAFNVFNLIGLKIEYPFLLAVIISIVDILPVLGVGTVLNPWALWMLVTGNYPMAIALFITYAIIFVVRQFLEPKLVSKQFGIHPLVTLFAMYAGFKMAGVGGLLLGPITLMILKCIFAKQIEKGLFKDLFDEK